MSDESPTERRFAARRTFTPSYRNLSPPTRLYYFRHGDVDRAVTHGLYGQQDVPLSEEGERQSRVAAARLEGVELDGVYSSDLERSLHLARSIAEPRGMTVEGFPEFRERHFGIWQGKTWEEIEAGWPELLAEYERDFLSMTVPEGENFNGIRERVMGRLDELLERHRHGTLALVAHAGCNRVIVADALGLPLANIFNIWQAPACMNVIDYYDDGRAVVRLVGG